MARNQAGEATFNAIVSAAVEAFSDSGFDGVSIRAIGARAGVTLGAVHHHFSGKADLYKECVRHADSIVREQLYKELADLIPVIDPLEALERAIGVGLSFVRRNQPLVRFLVRSYMQDHARVEQRDRVKQQGGMLTLAASLFARNSRRNPKSVRVACMTLSFAIVRFAFASDEELCFIADEEDVEAALETVRQSLVEMAMASLGPLPESG